MSRGDANNGSAGGGDHFGDDWVEFSSSSNRGSWLVTYADMMTILLAFMIMLLSVSQIAHTKFDMLVEALTGRKVGNLQKVKEKIDHVVEKTSLGGQVTTSIDEDGLKVQFSNALLFSSGEAELTEEAVDVFRPISDHLVNDLEPAYGVTIEGYTDDVPIENGHFDSNWELSTSRAIHVMKRLAQEGFDRRRMSVQGFADTRAATDVPLYDDRAIEELSDEKLDEIRAKNRRVVIRINRLDKDVLRDILADKPGVEPPSETEEGEGASGEKGEEASDDGSGGGSLLNRGGDGETETRESGGDGAGLNKIMNGSNSDEQAEDKQ